MMARRVIWWGREMALMGGLGLAALGCSEKGGDRPAIYPVTGRVEFRGKPADGAFVVFHPVGTAAAGEEKPTARVQPDGTFTVTSHGAESESSGAPAGEYAVTVEWRKLVVDGKDAAPGPNVISPRYSDPKATPIKAMVAEGPNQLDPIVIK